MTKRWLRWLPAAVVPAVIAAGAVAAHAAAPVDLPDKTPKQLVAMIAGSDVDGFSGTVRQSSDLGLPTIPSAGPGANDEASSVLELLTGAHTARVYVDGPGKERVQTLDSLAEQDVVRNGRDVWLYDSQKNEAVHTTLPAHAGKPKAESHTPAEIAERLVDDLDSSTKTSVGPDTSVAGRDAYDLVLTPRGSTTLVGSVSVAVDAKTGLPLRVAVTARGADDPAMSIAFTKLDLSTPAASLFDFTPPDGATVTEKDLSSHLPSGWKGKAGPEPVVSGSGWASVVELPAGIVPQKVLGNGPLAQLTTPVSGGRALSTSLVTVLLTDDGRVLAGAVPLEVLQAAAGR